MRRLVLVSLSLALASCGGDGGTGPDNGGGVKFPPIPADVLATMCIRGQIVPPKTVSGTISNADCQQEGVPDYLEGWRVRVKTSGGGTFRVSADFSGNIFLYAVDPDNVAGMLQLDREGLSAGGGGAVITHTLLSGSEYWVYVEYFDLYSGDSGSYTLTVTQ